MDPHTAELTTVIEHDASGRIRKFVKYNVPLDCVPGLKAVARLREEENEADKLIKSSEELRASLHDKDRQKAVIEALKEKAKLPSAPAPAPMPAPQLPPTPAPLPQPSPSPTTHVIHHHLVTPQPTHRALKADTPKRETHQHWVNEQAERYRQHKLNPPKRHGGAMVHSARQAIMADVRKEMASVEACIEESKQVLEAIVSRTIGIATRDGKSAGRAVMSKLLELVPPDTPNTATVTFKGEAIQSAMQQVYDQLCSSDYCGGVRTVEYAKAFSEAFMLGVHEVKREFETTPRKCTSTETTA
jgi:hypothetical protein